MPFRHSGPTTIRSFQFRENTYEFSIESVLEAESASGKLLIEASPEYRLTTPAERIPQARLALDYTRQPDGSYLVRASVTLLVSGPLLVSGHVTLRDPAGEVSRLTIAIQATLLLSDAILTINKPQFTDPDDVVAVLKITQQGTSTPVTLTTDDPDRFGLAASGRQLNFQPSLTITPVSGQFYVHIRYTPDRAGKHQAWLIVQTPYDRQLVALQGVAGKWVNKYQLPGWSAGRRASSEWLGQPVTRRIQRVHILGILAMLGLLLANYVYRAPFTARPGLWQHPVAVDTTYPDNDRVVPEQYTAEAIEQRFKNKLTRRVTADPRLMRSAEALADPATQTRSPALAKAVPAGLAKRRTIARGYPLPIRGGRGASPSMPLVNGSESDLEQELNARPTHKDRVEWIQLAPVFQISIVSGHHPRKRPI